MDYYVEKNKETVDVSKKKETKDNVEVTETALLYLDETRKWAKFIAAFCIVMAALMFIGALVLLLGGVKAEVPGSGMLGCIYFVSSILTVVPMWFLLRFSKSTKKAVANRNTTDLEEALKYQKMYYITAGIMVIIAIIFVVAFIIAGFTMGFVSAMMQSQNV